jgi:hypothetical protein
MEAHALRFVRKDGAAPAGSVPLASLAYAYGVAPAVDDTCVYWVAIDTVGPPWRGSIMKMVKPL